MLKIDLFLFYFHTPPHPSLANLVIKLTVAGSVLTALLVEMAPSINPLDFAVPSASP